MLRDEGVSGTPVVSATPSSSTRRTSFPTRPRFLRRTDRRRPAPELARPRIAAPARATFHGLQVRPRICAPAIRKGLRLAAGRSPGKYPRDVALSAAEFADALDAAAARPPSPPACRFAERGEDRASSPRDPTSRARGPLARQRTAPRCARTTRRVDPLDRRDAARVPAAPRPVGGAIMKPAGRGQRGAWIFTSATLAVGATSRTRRNWARRREHRRLGESVRLCGAGAPLRPARPARAQLARAHGCRARRRAAAARASEDRAFLLFTTAARSRRRANVADRLGRRGLDLRCSCRARLALRAPRAIPRTRQRDPARQREIWEGVDVPGNALSLVVIDKAAVRAAGRSSARRAARPPEERGQQSVHGVAAAAGR